MFIKFVFHAKQLKLLILFFLLGFSLALSRTKSINLDIYLISLNHKSESRKIRLSVHVRFKFQNPRTCFANFSYALILVLNKLITLGVLQEQNAADGRAQDRARRGKGRGGG